MAATVLPPETAATAATIPRRIVDDVVVDDGGGFVTHNIDSAFGGSERNECLVFDQSEQCLARVFDGLSSESFDIYCLYNLLDIKERVSSVPVCALRLAYFRSVFNKINLTHDGPGLATNFLSIVDREVSNAGGESTVRDAVGGVEGAQFALARAIFRLPARRLLRVMKAIERDSRGQAANPVWHALRVDTVSATRFHDVLATRKIAFRKDLDVRHSSEAVRFGMQCESAIAQVLREFVAEGRGGVSDIGLLLDPASGVLGASLDFCSGLSRDDDGLLVVAPGAAIFEIKCRFKYLRSRDDRAVQGLLDDPGLQSFADFILDHHTPAVEFRHQGQLPTSRECLVSYDRVFRQSCKRRRTGVVSESLRLWIDGLIKENSEVLSTVFVFDARAAEGETGAATCVGDDDEDFILSAERPPLYLDLFLKAAFAAPVFANPRHPYYCQTLVQHYVLSQYYINAHRDPERMSPDELPSVYLVSAILRKRDESERGRVIRINGHRSDCDEVPLCVVVTPVRLDPHFARDAVSSVLDVWEGDIGKKTGLALWVQSAVNSYVAACIPTPRTP
ncbi:M98 protein [Murid betaherpesvirus 1]|uniref:M98 protein n=1 Tax=Murid herpesvirus 1 TaxID=10366 RepID=H2A1F2_MUHV1|nr:M98 protein [Murid betaherpesvirus 1]